MIKKYHVKSQNIYNFDEKEFLLDICQSTKWIVFISSLKKKQILDVVQDESREFLSLLASICANGSGPSPALIYQGKSWDMQDTWLNDFDAENHQAYFAASSNGWSSDEYGLVWLQQVFNCHTKEKSRTWLVYLLLMAILLMSICNLLIIVIKIKFFLLFFLLIQLIDCSH
jgi:DDE superfamily endonuclease.